MLPFSWRETEKGRNIRGLDHALPLLAVGLLADLAGGLFVAGILLFSGSLYLLALTDLRFFGLITPFRGVCFLAGWALLLLSILRS